MAEKFPPSSCACAWYARYNQANASPAAEAKRPHLAYRRLPHNALLVGHDDPTIVSLAVTMEKSRCIDYAKTSTATVWYEDTIAPICIAH